MKLKTFRGKTMGEVLAQVKRQYGRDAVILSTRTATKGGLFGLGGTPYVEITATRDIPDLPSPVRRGRVEEVRSGHSVCAEGAAKRVDSVPTNSCSSSSTDLLSEVRTLKSLVTDLAHRADRRDSPDIPKPLYGAYRRLVECAITDKLAEQIIQRVRDELASTQLHDSELVRAKLAGLLEGMLPTAGPIRVTTAARPMTIALIGPTGVGKTTTIAKLAANLCLREGRKVGLITIDTYRIAAVEQLRTYAEIIDVPLEVAVSPRQLKEGLARMADRDVVLIDTAGRSQRDAPKVQELQAFFREVRPDEVHLVLSSVASEGVLLQTIERFQEFDVDRVILTKLDEAIGFGVILSCLQKANAKLSYVTTGQDVPDDIAVGDGKALAKLILDGDSRILDGAERAGQPQMQEAASGPGVRTRPSG